MSNKMMKAFLKMRYTVRDSGMQGDQVCQKIVCQAWEFVCEGGSCQILSNWAKYTGQGWRERLSGWFKGTGCDVWVIRSQTRGAESYASTWIRHTERAEPERFPPRFEEWIAYYEQQRLSLREPPG